MQTHDRRITAGAEIYHARGRGAEWRVVPPTRAVVVDPGPYRIVTRRQGALYFTSAVRDNAGNAIMVQLDGEAKPRAVRAEELRGLWLETLAATGRTVAGVKAHGALLSAIAGSGRDVTVGDMLQLAANDQGMPDEVLTTLAEVVDGE